MNELIIFLAGCAATTVVFIIIKLFQRIAALEEGQRTRLPYKAIDNLEDLQAVLLDVERYLEATQIRTRAAQELYGMIRNGNFDPDRPAGRRPE